LFRWIVKLPIVWYLLVGGKRVLRNTVTVSREICQVSFKIIQDPMKTSVSITTYCIPSTNS
jgi:hypothetical protein